MSRQVRIIIQADGTAATNTALRSVTAEGQKLGNTFDKMDQSMSNQKGFGTTILQSQLMANAISYAGRQLLQFARDFKAFITESVTLAGELQQSVANSLSIKPNLDTSQVFTALSEMQRRVPQTSKQLSEALYNVFSSINVTQTDALKLVEKFARGATAAVTDANTFGTAVIGVMNAYGKKLEDVDHIQDVFFNTVAGGVVTGQELAVNLGLVTQAAKNMGVDFDNMGAMIAGVTKEGGMASQNMNNLANMFQKLPTKEVQDALHDLKIETVDIRTGAFLPILDVLDQLKEKLDKMPQAMRAAKLQQIVPDNQARAGLQTVLSQLGFIHDQLELNQTASGSAATAYSTMAATYVTASTLQENAVRSFQEALGMAVVANDVAIKSTQIVTEQINGYTESLNTAGSATNDFAKDVSDEWSSIKANTIPFFGFLTSSVRLLADTLGLILGSLVYSIAKVIEVVLGSLAEALNGFLNLFIAGYNKVAALAGLAQADLIPSAGAFMSSDKMKAGLSSTLADMKVQLSAIKQFAAEGGKVDADLEAARKLREEKRQNAKFQDTQTEDPLKALEAQQRLSLSTDLVAQAKALQGKGTAGLATTAGGGTGGKKLSKEELIDNLVNYNAKRTGLDPDLLRAIMGQESGGKAGALSNKGAAGLMQLMPGTAKDYGVKNRFDPAQNIRGSSDLIVHLMELFHGDINKVLAAYNAGEGAVQKYGGIPPYNETQDYVKKVKQRYTDLKTGKEKSIQIQFEETQGGKIRNYFFTPNEIDEIRAKLLKSATGPLTDTPGTMGTFVPQAMTPEQDFRQQRVDSVNADIDALVWRQRNFEQEKGLELTRSLTVQGQAMLDVDLQLFLLHQQSASAQFSDGRRMLSVKNEQLDLERQVQQVQDEMATGPYNESLRIQLALLQDINAIRRRDEEAIISSNRSRLEIADKTVYHEAQANAQVLRFLESQKSMTDIVADAKIGIMQKTFDGVDSLLDRIIPKMHGFGDILKQIIADLLKLQLSKFFMRLLGLDSGSAPGGTPSFNPSGGGAGGGGGGGWLDMIRNALGMGGGGAGPATAGANAFAGPSASAAMGGGGMSAFAGPSVAAALGLGGAATAAGGTAITAGALNAFAAPSVAAMTGGGSAAAGGAAAGGSSMLGSMGALFTNPWTAVVAGAAIGAFFLWKHFSKGTEKKLRAAIKSTYGVDIKDMKVLTQIKQMGEQTFGKGKVDKNISGVLALEPVKELVKNYAESTGQSTSLTTQRDLMDPAFAGNNFLIPSSPIATPSVPAIAPAGGVGSGSGSSDTAGRSAPSGSSNVQVGALAESVAALNAVLNRLSSMPAGQLMQVGLDENPSAASKAVLTAADSDYGFTEQMLTKQGFRK